MFPNYLNNLFHSSQQPNNFSLQQNQQAQNNQHSPLGNLFHNFTGPVPSILANPTATISNLQPHLSISPQNQIPPLGYQLTPEQIQQYNLWVQTILRNREELLRLTQQQYNSYINAQMECLLRPQQQFSAHTPSSTEKVNLVDSGSDLKQEDNIILENDKPALMIQKSISNAADIEEIRVYSQEAKLEINNFINKIRGRLSDTFGLNNILSCLFELNAIIQVNMPYKGRNSELFNRQEIEQKKIVTPWLNTLDSYLEEYQKAYHSELAIVCTDLILDALQIQINTPSGQSIKEVYIEHEYDICYQHRTNDSQNSSPLTNSNYPITQIYELKNKLASVSLKDANLMDLFSFISILLAKITESHQYSKEYSKTTEENATKRITASITALAAAMVSYLERDIQKILYKRQVAAQIKIFLAFLIKCKTSCRYNSPNWEQLQKNA